MSKFCVNCVHYFHMNGTCLLTGKLSVDYVTGKMKSRYNYATNERGIHGTCGDKGDLYKAENNMLVRFMNKNPYFLGGMMGIGLGGMIGTGMSYIT